MAPRAAPPPRRPRPAARPGEARPLAVWPLAAWLLAGGARARSIVDFPADVRHRNVVQVTEKVCDECTTLQSLYASNELVFILFYERALVNNHYKTAIVSGFHESCADLRYSHVVCGAVDMLQDEAAKGYAAQYIDPQTAPAHIIVRRGEPLKLEKRHLKLLMSRPGHKETILWHLGDVLAAGGASSDLQVSREAAGSGDVDRALRSTSLLVVGAFPDGKGRGPARDAFRAAAQRLVLGGEVRKQVGASRPAGAPLRADALFLFAASEKVASASNLTAGAAALFVDGSWHAEAALPAPPSGWASGEDAALRSLRAALAAAPAPAPAAGAGAGAGGRPRRRRRRRRRAASGAGSGGDL